MPGLKRFLWFFATQSQSATRDIASALHFTNFPDFEHVQIVSTLPHFQAHYTKLSADFIKDDVTRLLGEVLVDCEAETKSFVLICIFKPRNHFNQPSPRNISLFSLHIISWNPLHQLLHVPTSSAGWHKNLWRKFGATTFLNFQPVPNNPVLWICYILFCHPPFVTWTSLESKWLG